MKRFIFTPRGSEQDGTGGSIITNPNRRWPVASHRLEALVAPGPATCPGQQAGRALCPPKPGCVCALGRFVISPSQEKGVPLGAALRPGSHRATRGGWEQRGPSAQWSIDLLHLRAPSG